MRAAMRRCEREDLALDQASVLRPWAGRRRSRRRPRRTCATRAARARPRRRASVVEPVPEVLRAVRELEPLWRVERTLGADQVDRAAIDRARHRVANVPRGELEERADRLDTLLATFPHNQVEASRREQRLAAVRDELAEAHQRIGEQHARLDHLGPLSRLFGRTERDDAERALANWTNRAEILNEQAWGLEREVDVDHQEREQWFDGYGDELIEFAAAKLELHRRDEHARERRINDIRRDPPDWATERLGPRPDDPIARPQWDRAAAHLDDYREAFGHLPPEQPPELARLPPAPRLGASAQRRHQGPRTPPRTAHRPAPAAPDPSRHGPRPGAMSGDDKTLGEAQRYAKPLLTLGVSCCSRSPVKAQRKRSRLDAWGRT